MRKAQPQVHQWGGTFVVRWYNPVEKRVRVYRTKRKRYADVFMRGL